MGNVPSLWVDIRVNHSRSCDMFNVCVSVLNTGVELLTIEKHMQERVAQVFFVIFSAVLHCAELGRHVRQQAHVSKPY
jgi:dUTPase